MRVIIEVDGDLSDILTYWQCVKIDTELIRSVKFENETNKSE